MQFNYNTPSIAVLTHTQYKDNIPIYGPTDSIRDFLKANFRGDVFYLRHSLYSGDGSILIRDWEGKSKIVYRYNFHSNWNNIARYMVDFLYTVKLLLSCSNISIIIATDPLNFLCGYFLKKIKRIKKIIFFTVDYGYKRFDNRFLNWVYHSLDKFAVRHANMFWNSSCKISEVRARQGVKDGDNIYIPNTPLSENVKVKSVDEIERYTLVMVFSNYLQVDFKIIFDALSYLVNDFPMIKIRLIGRGNFQEPVSKIIQDRYLLRHIEFLDTHTHLETLEQLSRCAIGLECNTQELYWNEFREPIKLREYISFGLPIISKPGHALVQEILEEKIGFVVNNSGEFIEAVKAFFGDYHFYCEMREKVLRLAEKYNKEKILFGVFRKLGVALEATHDS